MTHKFDIGEGSQCFLTGPCRPGTYALHSTQGPCFLCPRGTYQPASSQLGCISCPANTTTLSEGSDAIDDCIRKSKGRYKCDAVIPRSFVCRSLCNTLCNIAISCHIAPCLNNTRSCISHLIFELCYTFAI